VFHDHIDAEVKVPLAEAKPTTRQIPVAIPAK
jgi:hypothetical protein